MTRIESRKMDWSPWPFSNRSFIPIKRCNAALMLTLMRRHNDKESARKHRNHMRAWLAHLDAPGLTRIADEADA